MWVDHAVANLFCVSSRLMSGAQAIWKSPLTDEKRRIFYANHRSHGDFVLIWSSMPGHRRSRTRPVAAADYWLKGRVRRFLIQHIFRGVLIDRQRGREGDPIGAMSEALVSGDSLILFPEGTRNLSDDLLPFKSGLYYIARENPDVELVPVWIDNLGRALPKGGVIPVPLVCSVTFGHPLQIDAGEAREDFLSRARVALLNLAPGTEEKHG